MLENSLLESRRGGETRKPLTVAIAVVAHAVAVTLLVLVPLLETHALPLPSVNSLPLPPAPRMPDNLPIPVFAAQPHRPVTPIAVTLTEPASIPLKIASIDDTPGPAMIGLLPAGSGSIGQFLSGLTTANAADLAPASPNIAPPAPPPPPAPVSGTRSRYEKAESSRRRI